MNSPLGVFSQTSMSSLEVDVESIETRTRTDQVTAAMPRGIRNLSIACNGIGVPMVLTSLYGSFATQRKQTVEQWRMEDDHSNI